MQEIKKKYDPDYFFEWCFWRDAFAAPAVNDKDEPLVDDTRPNPSDPAPKVEKGKQKMAEEENASNLEL